LIFGKLPMIENRLQFKGVHGFPVACACWGDDRTDCFSDNRYSKPCASLLRFHIHLFYFNLFITVRFILWLRPGMNRQQLPLVVIFSRAAGRSPGKTKFRSGSHYPIMALSAAMLSS
jgi:hypothetical protein